MASYNSDRPRRTEPVQVPGLNSTDIPRNEKPPSQDEGQPPSAVVSSTDSNNDPTPAPTSRLLPRNGLPDRMLLVAGTITAVVGLVALVGLIAWWRRHRITISRVTKEVSEPLEEIVTEIFEFGASTTSEPDNGTGNGSDDDTGDN